MNDTLIDSTAAQVISDIGTALRSAALLVGAVLTFRVKGNVSRAMLSDAAFHLTVGVFLITATLRTTAITFDIAMLADLLNILSAVGLARTIPRSRR